VTAGRMIGSARIASGHSVEDLAALTRLRASILTAMEQDDFSMCGGDAYAKGHLRTLAPILGLDPDALVSAYEGESH
jgi:cytoskeletal protein RodZ